MPALLTNLCVLMTTVIKARQQEVYIAKIDPPRLFDFSWPGPAQAPAPPVGGAKAIEPRPHRPYMSQPPLPVHFSHGPHDAPTLLKLQKHRPPKCSPKPSIRMLSRPLPHRMDFYRMPQHFYRISTTILAIYTVYQHEAWAPAGWHSGPPLKMKRK